MLEVLDRVVERDAVMLEEPVQLVPGWDVQEGRLPLACVLTRALERRGLTDAAAAKVLAVSRPEVVALRRYQLADFDMGRLVALLVALG